MESVRIAALLLLGLAAFAAPAAGLSTSGTSIVNENGYPVRFRGTTWYGFNVPNYGNFLGDMTMGVDSISKDVRTGLWRQKALGFNAIRLPFTFDILTRPAIIMPGVCPVASWQTVIDSVFPPGVPSKPVPFNPPGIWGGVCNAGMPIDTAWNQYLWTVQYALYQGYYVQLDFHGNKYGDQAFYDTAYFIDNWKKLLTQVLKLKGAKGRIMIDPANEPDGYDCTWASCQGWGTLTKFYTQVFDALYPICKDCLFLVEGAGQAAGWSNYGDGFTTDPAVIQKIRGYVTGKGQDPATYTDATPFFQAIHFAKWQKQIVLAPHPYCPAVTGAEDHFEGTGLWERLQWSFGDKQAQGFTYKGTTKKYPVLIGEFGSNLGDANEVACMNSIIQYMNNEAPGYEHPIIDSFFYWVWNPDSVDTLGLLAPDWRAISWSRVNLLSNGLGLKPWYQSGVDALAATEDSALRGRQAAG
jgi:aryl-phospho-beta-D-glucosidase BglC (GH1 family)